MRASENPSQQKFRSEAHSPAPMDQEPPCGKTYPEGIMRKQGSRDNTRRKPVSVPEPHRCWTAAMRTAEKSSSSRQ
jgi:hypothetical protein